MAKRKTVSLSYPQLSARRYFIEQAIDELTVIEQSGRIEDLAGLSQALDSYSLSRFPFEIRASVYRIDGFVLVVKATCLDMEEKQWITPAEMKWIRAYLERALSVISPLTP